MTQRSPLTSPRGNNNVPTSVSPKTSPRLTHSMSTTTTTTTTNTHSNSPTRLYLTEHKQFEAIRSGAPYPTGPWIGPRSAHGLYVPSSPPSPRRLPALVANSEGSSSIRVDTTQCTTNNEGTSPLAMSVRKALMGLKAYDADQPLPRPPPILEPKGLLSIKNNHVVALTPIKATDTERYTVCYRDGEPRRLASTETIRGVFS